MPRTTLIVNPHKLAAFVRNLRQTHVITQRELTIATRVSEPLVRQIEAGNARPTTMTLAKLARFAGIHLDLLVSQLAPSPAIEEDPVIYAA